METLAADLMVRTPLADSHVASMRDIGEVVHSPPVTSFRR